MEQANPCFEAAHVAKSIVDGPHYAPTANLPHRRLRMSQRRLRMSQRRLCMPQRPSVRLDGQARAHARTHAHTHARRRT